MKNRIIVKLIYSLFFIFFLFFILFNNLNATFMIIPFIIAAIGIFLQNLFLLLKKEKYVQLSNKIFIIGFLLYLFLFIIFFSFISIVDKQYSSLLFMIPFLLIGILLVRKYIFNKKTNLPFMVFIPVMLVGICLIAGLFLLVTGIKDTYETSIKIKDYLTVNGYFYDYDIYSQDEDGVTYQLKYRYEIDGELYSISTNYGSNYIPEINSIREIKYNPIHPNEAILIGTNSNNLRVFMGAFFTLGSFTFVLFYFYIKGYFDRFKIDIIGTYMATVILLFGIGMIVIQTGTTLSLMKTIESMGLWIIIPIVMILSGSYLLIKNIFYNKRS